jgi:tRNA1(Val) A37 N6-methylase TrmN6
MDKTFDFYNGIIKLQNGPGCYKITEDPLWLLSIIPSNCKSYLDVGCGTGVLSLILRLKNPDSIIKAVDVQTCMIKQAKDHAQANNIENIDFVVEDLYDIPSTEKYSCVFSNPPFFTDCSCYKISDKVRSIAYVQKDIKSFILKQLDLVEDSGCLCFIGHISNRSCILDILENKYNLTEIALVSSQNKVAKRFIYIVKKVDAIQFSAISLNSFDCKIRKDILNNYKQLKIEDFS